MKIKVSNMNCINCLNKLKNAFELNDVEVSFDLDNKFVILENADEYDVAVSIITASGYVVEK